MSLLYWSDFWGSLHKDKIEAFFLPAYAPELNQGCSEKANRH